MSYENQNQTSCACKANILLTESFPYGRVKIFFLILLNYYVLFYQKQKKKKIHLDFLNVLCTCPVLYRSTEDIVLYFEQYALIDF